MRSSFSAIGFALLALAASVDAASGQCVVPRQRHAWGRWKVGSWKEVQILYENLDANGNVVSSSVKDTRTTLVAVDDETYTLKLDVTVHVAGKEFTGEPQTVTYRFDGETDGETTKMKKVGDTELKIDEVLIPCDVCELVVASGETKRKSTIYYNKDIAPYVLKRETTTTDAKGNDADYSTVVEVTAVSMPHNVLSQVKSVSHVKTVHHSPKGTTVTREFFCPDVPGGVVYHSSRELDDNGVAIRQSTLRLVDYDLGDGELRAEGRRFLFRRGRKRKSSR